MPLEKLNQNRANTSTSFVPVRRTSHPPDWIELPVERASEIPPSGGLSRGRTFRTTQMNVSTFCGCRTLAAGEGADLKSCYERCPIVVAAWWVPCGRWRCV